MTATTPVAGSPYATSCSGAIDSNYAITYISGVLTLHAAPLTVTASSGSSLYDHPIPVITPSYVGFVNNQTASLLDPGPVCSTTAVVASLVGSYPTSCTGAVDSNYSFTYVNGALAIMPSVVPLLPALVAQGCQVYGQTYFDGLPGSSYAVTSGSLPSGITLNSSSGLLGGTATMAGTSVFTVSATPPGYAVVSHGYLLTVGLCVGPDSGVLPGASYGTPYSNAVTTTGGTPTYRYQLQGGALPPGLTMAANGTISGTPSVRGTFSVTIGATDSANPANEGQHLLTLTVS